MKTFGKIVAGFFVFLLILFIGLNLYFTDQRLKDTVLPHLTEATGQPVQVEHISLSFFTTFPHPGIEIDNMHIAGTADSDTLFSLDQMVAGVEMLPFIFSDQVNVTELVLNEPQFTYKVYEDSTTNLDFLFEESEIDTAQSGGYNVNIPYFEISNGRFGYNDFTSGTTAQLNDFDGDLSLSYADSIATTIDVEIGGVSATVDSLTYFSNLPLSLTQESVLYPNREVLKLNEGTFAIRGLEMDLNGSLSNWSEAFTVDLQFSSVTDNFGDLLQLLPENEYTTQLETEGSLDLGGTVNGAITDESTPSFDIAINVENGSLKDPELPQPIRNIQISAQATDKLITIGELNAVAGENSLSASGNINEPLEDNATFDLDFNADADLSTVNKFYDISQLGIQQMAGQLNVNANAEGRLDQPEKAAFNGKAMLSNGMMQYEGVPKPITNINVNASGSQDLLTIESLRLQAAQNSLSASGRIENLLDETSRRINNMNTSLQFNLATLKDFYPLDEDTLQLAGMLNAQATLDGKADPIERAVKSGTITLDNGQIDYYEFDESLRDITFEAVLNGPRMTINTGSFASGENNVQASGVINNYLSENRTVNLKTKGNAKLGEIRNYYSLEPNVTDLSGDADFDLTISGPPSAPASLNLSGVLSIQNGNMNGEALSQPIKNLTGRFNLSPQQASLSELTFMLGSSDVDVSGALQNYMAYLQKESKRSVTPKLTGQFSSKNLNVDELVDWSDTTSFILELPDLNSSVQAEIGRMTVFGVDMRNLKARASTTPEQINMSEASVELFEGKASGTMRWQIPTGQPSTFNFKGVLDSLRLESFFEDYPILGQDSRFHQFISGTFSSSVDYTTKITPDLEPLIATTIFDGTFGMSKARVEDHPLQEKLISYTKINALSNVALDKWNSSLSVDDNILTINNLSLTSDDIGLELNGTQNLETEKVDFSIALLLPSRFKNTIASVITGRAADALTRDNGTIMVPLRVTGTYGNPKIQPDQTVIKPMVEKSLKDKAKNTLKGFFGRDKEEAKQDTTAPTKPDTTATQPDTAGADTTSSQS